MRPAALALLLAAPLAHAAPVPKGGGPPPIPAATVAEYVKLGAEAGWMTIDRYGRMEFAPGVRRPAGATYPALKLRKLPPAPWPKIPVPFALDLENVDFDGIDDPCGELAGMTTLAALVVDWSHLEDCLHSRLKDFGNLRALEIPTLVLGAKCKTKVELPPKLRTLDLPGADISEVSPETLAGWKDLTGLCLGHWGVSGEQLRDLAELPALEYLVPGGYALRDNGLATLKGCRRLVGLDLRDHGVQASHLEDLRAVPGLVELDLSRNLGVDKAAVRVLKHFPKLARLNLADTAVGDAAAAALLRDCNLSELSLAHTPVTAQGLAGLAGQQRLTALDLSDTAAGDAAVTVAAGLPTLDRLNLAGTKVTDAGVAALGGRASLSELSLSATATTDAGLAGWKVFERLAWLDLAETKVTGIGLKRFPRLTALVLAGTKLADAGAADLAALPDLVELHLDRTAVTDAGLKHLERLTNLEDLRLTGTTVTDAGLKRLHNLTNLRYLDLHGTKVTDDGVAELQKALPLCGISR